MLILPLHGQLSWRRPPLVTLALIALNVALHAITQARDEGVLERALDYYFDSPLAAIELPRYAAARSGSAPPPALRRDSEQAQSLLAEMEDDDAFMARLRAGEIVAPSEPDYARWKAAREQFDRLRRDSTARRYGFIPAEHRPLTFLTHMFLHGDWGHVAGNMLLLFIVGFMMEVALGWWRYLGAYLLTGLTAVSLFWLTEPASGVPLVGASGAVSGIVGVYAAVFGLRRINFFFFVWVYFDYVRAPAILLLLLWIANEAYQLLTDPIGQIAYTAHLGGLLGGALVTGLAQVAGDSRLRAFRGSVDRDEASATSYRRALELMGQFRFEEAAAIMDQVTALRPDDHEVLLQAFNIAKHVPDSHAFHSIAARVFDLPTGNRAMLELVRDALREYMGKARPGPRISTSQVASLATRLADGGMIEDSEKLGTALLSRRASGPDVLSALGAIAEACERLGNPQRGAYWRRHANAGAGGTR